MRNIFDQYFQPENRVTHALMSALNEDRDLLNGFLRDLVKVKPPVPVSKLTLLEQQYPGEIEQSEDALEQRGIPDGWIFAEDEAWCVLIECKVLGQLHNHQITRHSTTAKKMGFQTITAVAITAGNHPSPDEEVVYLEWQNVYRWLHERKSSWAKRMVDYLEIMEAKLVNSGQLTEGTLTTFTGFTFHSTHPYTYLEGKRVLKLALTSLRVREDLQEQLGVSPNMLGRSAITGRQGSSVWDFLSISRNAVSDASFTDHPHLTLGVSSEAVEAMVTVPNGVRGSMRRNLKKLGDEGFRKLVQNISNELNTVCLGCPGATPWFRGIQRRYHSQRATPLTDASIEFDLRTQVESSEGPKTQPLWLNAAYGAFIQKNGANYQIQMGMRFRYDRCPEIQKPNALDLISASWLCCRSFVELARDAEG